MKHLIVYWTYYYPLILLRDLFGLISICTIYVFDVLDRKVDQYERESFWGRQ